MEPQPKIPADRIVVMMPNWLGDAVMATPFLRALRTRYPAAHIAALARFLVSSVVTGLPFVNDLHILDKSNPKATRRYLRQNHFDLGILLPNSFRSAWTLFRGGVKHRLGYAREGRSLLLTHKLFPVERYVENQRLTTARFIGRELIRLRPRGADYDITAVTPILDQPGKYKMTAVKRSDPQQPIAMSDVGAGARYRRARGRYQPIPQIEYYLQLVRYLRGDALPPASRGLYGASPPASRGLYEDDRSMQLVVTPEEKSEADQALVLAGITAGDVLVVIVPGANFGASKCWPPERFAQVADRIMDRPERGGTFGAQVLLASSPAELPIVEAILAKSLLCPDGGGIGRLHALAKFNNGKGVSLGALKEIVRRSRLMICNDTGPRHFAAAFNIPRVTLFGPTDPVWAETFSKNEKIVRLDVPCGPCQLKTCPIDHRCMTGLTVDMVMAAIADLWHNSSMQETPDVDPRTSNSEPL